MPVAACPLFVFLDEAGNFDFSPNGTKYFVLTSVRACPTFPWDVPLLNLKYEHLRLGLPEEYFHASEDKQTVRDRVFEVLSTHTASMQIDSIIIEKRKTGPALRDPIKFYALMLGILLRYALDSRNILDGQEVIITTDSLPLNKKRKAMEKAIKEWLSKNMSPTLKYKLYHHSSKSCLGLQVVDYCNWAIYKKWQEDDHRSYIKISQAIKSEFDVFQSGNWDYYRNEPIKK